MIFSVKNFNILYKVYLMKIEFSNPNSVYYIHDLNKFRKNSNLLLIFTS